MEYDLIRLWEHDLCLFELIPSAIVTFEAGETNRCAVEVEWRRSAGEVSAATTVTLTWDHATLRPHLPHLDRQLRTRRDRDDDRATRTEEAAVVVAAAVLAHLEPETRFTRRSDTGTRHDYYLNDTDDEMIEVAGRWEGGLPGLFDQKRAQSDLNPGLRRRWVSVTIARTSARNRTEGLHP